jgi:hypothetical protein
MNSDVADLSFYSATSISLALTTSRVPAFWQFLCFLGLRLDVTLNEKLSEQGEQGQDVDNVGKDHPETGGGALRGEQVGALRHHCHKLDHLHHRKARLPPNRQGLSSDRILGAGVNKVGNKKHKSVICRRHERHDTVMMMR